MAFAVRIIEPNLIVGRLFNPFHTKDIEAMLRGILDERCPLRGSKIFCDASEATPGDLSFTDMKAVTDFVKSRIDDFAGMKFATFASGLLNYGFARMAGELTNGLPYEYRAFRDQDLAFNWLSITPAMLAEIHGSNVG